LPITSVIEEDNSKEERDQEITPVTDFQRKIVPQWEGLVQNDNEIVRQSLLTNKRRTKLIVVASLVDKVPNLAGLARTCEIFNVGTLVIPNSKISKDSMFQSISVTSEKWLPIIEVPEGGPLVDFLTSKREEGYTLLGLEQTAGSLLLDDYASRSDSFPSKTLLLLGKEKEGVPQLYFPLLHQCIEIPQLGVIRSLVSYISQTFLSNTNGYNTERSCFRKHLHMGIYKTISLKKTKTALNRYYVIRRCSVFIANNSKI